MATSTAELREIWLGRLCERGAAELDLRPGSGAVEPTKIEREVKKKTTRAPRTASPTSPRAPRRHRVTRRFTMRVLLALLGAASAFVGPAAPRQPTKLNVVDAALAAALASAPVDVAKLNSRLPTTTLAKTRTITREGLYGDYTVEIIDEPNPLDDARSTFKTRAQTKKGKNECYSGSSSCCSSAPSSSPWRSTSGTCATRRTRSSRTRNRRRRRPRPRSSGSGGVAV